jgi:uncharacterized protein
MVPQPQPLAKHLAHGVADRVVAAVAGHRLDLGPGQAQALLEGVGGVQDLADRAFAASRATPGEQCRDRQGGQQQEQDDGHGRGRLNGIGPQFEAVAAAPAIAADERGGAARRMASSGLTEVVAISNIPQLMSADLPGILDAWRMVATRRGLEGRVPLSSLTRLRNSLVDTEGEVRFALEFDTDALRVPYVELRIDAELPLTCQRSLQRFLYPVNIVQRLGLIRDEADEAALPEGYEPLLVPEDGQLRTVELVEDELILAVPVVPIMPGTEAVERDWPATEQAEEPERVNPFAALSALKKQSN